jgi:osmotically-inducible protein OsmY
MLKTGEHCPDPKKTEKNAAWLPLTDIRVAVSGHKATLTGTVDSWYQKSEAERIAWKAPGVWNVGNELELLTTTTIDRG